MQAQRCSRLDCDTCYAAVRARRGARLLERFGGVHCARVVLPFPQELWAPMTPSRVHRLRGDVAHLLRAWFAATHQGGPEVGLVVSTHPTGDRCKKCGERGDALGRMGECKCGEPAPWFPHFDVNVPLVGLVRVTGGQLGDAPVTPGEVDLGPWALHRLRYMVEEHHLGALRLAWGRVVAELARGLGVPPSTMFPEHQPAVAWYGFARVDWGREGHELDQVAHAWSYSARPFPAWYDALPPGLRRPQPYGLASPGASRTRDHHRRVAVEAWRVAVAGPQVEGGAPECPVCGAELDLVDSYRRHSEYWRMFAGTAARLDDQEEVDQARARAGVARRSRRALEDAARQGTPDYDPTCDPPF